MANKLPFEGIRVVDFYCCNRVFCGRKRFVRDRELDLCIGERVDFLDIGFIEMR